LLFCALTVAAAFSASWAQGAASGAAANPAVNNAAGDSVVHKKATAAADTNAAVRDTAAGKSAAKGLDLDKLLTGDHPEEDLLVDEKPAVKHAAIDSSSAVDSSSKVTEALDGDEKAPAAADASQDDTTASKAAVTRVTAQTDTADLAPLVINDGRTINFAQNLKEYRSPRIAMLLSLLVPGLGQAYSRSYVKAGAFGAAEVAVIGVAAYLNSVGKAKKREARRFADENFDPDMLRKYEARLRDYDAQLREKPDNPVGIDTLIFSYYDADFYAAAESKQTLYYESIRDMHFTPGWKDSDPGFDGIFSDADTIRGAHGVYVRSKPEVAELLYFITRVLDETGRAVNEGSILGFSPAQAEYDRLVRNSNAYYDAVNYTLYALLLNHIASAIDAGFTARAYNARLLGRESVWNNVSIGTQYVFTGSDVSPGLALKVRF
jgi:hypothetical protein